MGHICMLTAYTVYTLSNRLASDAIKTKFNAIKTRDCGRGLEVERNEVGFSSI